LRHDLDGAAVLDYAETGLRCRIDAPIEPAAAPV
jgi:hypothetical protein